MPKTKPTDVGLIGGTQSGTSRVNHARACLVPQLSTWGRGCSATGPLIGFAEASQPTMHAYLGLCAFAGLRLGETSAVQAGDVDFLGRRLHVQRQVQRMRGGPAEIRRPKYGSERTVYLPDRLLEMLAVHIERFGAADDNWLFFTGQGRPLPPSRWTAGGNGQPAGPARRAFICTPCATSMRPA